MRVLVATLVKQLYEQTLSGLFQQDWSGPTEYLFVKNDQPEGDLYDRLTALYQMVRERFLAGPYDALWTVEADMVVPQDALSRLLSAQADVAYGLYVWRHGAQHLWSAYQATRGTMCSMWDMDPDAAKRALLAGAALPVAGVGLGCTLIRRHVLERLPFRHGADPICNDWYFALDCQFTGHKQVCDFGVVCGHITPMGRVLWPDPERPNGWRAERLVEIAEYGIPE